MRQQEINYWITAMLNKHPRVSDLNLTVGKPLQVESDGVLVPVDVEPPVQKNRQIGRASCRERV